MAACKTCGGKAGAFKEECKVCEKSRLDREALERAEEERARAENEEKARAQAARELEERTQRFVNQALESINRTLAQNRTPYLYSMISVTVPYVLLEQEGGSLPDLHDLEALGRDGWEIVGTLPQTAGVGLTNVYQKGGGRTWAGGIGGIVTGMFLLIRLPITASTVEHEGDMLRAALRESYEDTRSFVSPEVLVPGASSGNQRGGISPLAGIAVGAAGMALMMDAASEVGIVGDERGFDGDSGGGDFDGGGFDF